MIKDQCLFVLPLTNTPQLKGNGFSCFKFLYHIFDFGNFDEFAITVTIKFEVDISGS